jgi:hypothetical protein
MEIPVSPNDLNEVVYNVARDVVEQMAIEGKIADADINDELTNEILDNVIFVVERYMYYINSLMDTQKLAQTPKIELK